MLNLVEPVAAGNALRLYLTPPPGAASWRVLRRTNPAAFAGPDDPGAVVVADGSDAESLLDDKALSNGTRYHYRVHYRDRSGAWLPTAAGMAVGAGTPAATYRGDGIDPQEIVRSRLEAGLAVEVERGALLPESGAVPVVDAPFSMVENITFPCVSVHLDTDVPAFRGVGEMLGPDEPTEDGDWTETEGWLARVVLSVVAVSLNGQERVALRKAVKRVIQANLSVFKAHGLDQIEFGIKDFEDPGPKEHAAILFMASGTFSCICPAFVSNDAPPVRDVIVNASAYQPESFHHG